MARGDVVVAEAQLQNVVAAVATHEAAVHDAELQSTRCPSARRWRASSWTIRPCRQAVGPAAPLFTVASDLGRVILHANVDESDIGRIEIGQEAAFTVDSFPGSLSWRGLANQAHAAGFAERGDLRRRAHGRQSGPAIAAGMTATASITTGKDSGALRVPTSALRFRPEGNGRMTGDAVWTVGEDGEPVVTRSSAGAATGSTPRWPPRSGSRRPGDRRVGRKRTDTGHRQSILGF